MANVVQEPVIVRATNFGDRKTIFIAIRATMVNGRPRKNIFQELAEQLGYKRQTVSRQWNKMSKKLAPLLYNHPEEQHGEIIRKNHHILFEPGHSAKRKGKFKYDREEMERQIAAVPLKERMTIRHLAGTIALPKTTVHNVLKPPLCTMLKAVLVLVRM
jgi:hypothetical protein